jgi:hypothetical protein
MAKLTNFAGISLPLAVWLASDDYDYQDGKTISATSLLKPVRQILLKERLTPETRKTVDIMELFKSRMGTSIHDGIEKAWDKNMVSAMLALGYSEDTIARFRINPTEEELRSSNSIIPVYMEQRGSRKFKDYNISGKFDMVIDGELKDHKSTSVYTLIKGTKDEDYRLQGSIYRWIHRDKIFSDHIAIQFIFTDWSPAKAKADPKYPQCPLMEHKVPLMSLDETDRWIDSRIRLLEKYADTPEPELPFCTDEELWRSAPVFKYFSDPAKAADPKARASKNFDTRAAAEAHLADKGKGAIVEKPGEVKACGYCAGYPLCSQKDLYNV